MIFQDLDVKTLDFEVAPDMIDAATPSDVYDLASVLVAELTHLHALQGGPQEFPRVFFQDANFRHTYTRRRDYWSSS